MAPQFLCNRDGKPVKRYAPSVQPLVSQFFWGGAKVISFLLLCPFVFRSSAKGPVIIYRGWRGGGEEEFWEDYMLFRGGRE